jgi:IclR family acetate operon transcriptional repressor
MSDGKTKSAGQVRSLTRALTLLTELSESASLPPSTTHRLLTTLESERFVRPDPQGGLWRIGVAAFFVGTAFARSRDKLSLARPYLRRLMETSGETANLFVESDSEAICIGQIESRHAMRAITGVGGRVLLHSSGTGKVLLAHMEASRRKRILSTMALPRETQRTIIDRRRLEAELDDILRLGYAVDDEEHALGLRCVAAPLFDELGRAVAAVSISGPSARIPAERLPILGRMVAQAALEATRDYGGAAPVSVP